jgi:hypothetical protein
MAIKDILDEQDALKAHEHQFYLYPRYWHECADVQIACWNMIKLNGSERLEVPEEPGIYTLLVQPGIALHPACSYLMYVGKSKSLRRRFGEYLNESRRETGRPKIVRLLNKYPDHLWFCYTLIEDEALDVVEDALIAAYVPPANDQMPAEVRGAVGAFR